MKCPACHEHHYTYQTMDLGSWSEYVCEKCSNFFVVKKKPLVTDCCLESKPSKRGEFIDGLF